MSVQTSPRPKPRATSGSLSSTRSHNGVARHETPHGNWLGFDAGLTTFAFAVAALTLLIAPYLFSDFWVVTRDSTSQSLWSGLAAVAAFLLALAPRSHNTPLSRTTKLLLVFFAWCVLSSVTTIYWHDTVLELARVLTGAMWFLILRELLLANNPEHRVLERRVAVLVGAVVLGLGVVCTLSAMDFLRTRNPRQFGTFFNPNLYANACAMTLPLALCVAVLLRRERKNLAVFGLALFALVLVGLLLTSSKGGLLAASCALVWCALIFARAQGERVKNVVAQHRVLVGVGATVLVLVVAFVAAQTVLPRLLNARGDDNSTIFRVYTWGSTWQMALARPFFGWGAGGFPHVHSQFAVVGTTQTAHQLWLQIASENGLPALLSLLASCALFARRAWRLSSARWPLALGAGGTVVAFAVHGLTDAGWSISSIVFLLMLAFALLETANNSHINNSHIDYSNEDAQDDNVSRLRLGWIGVALLMGASSWVAQRVATGEELREASQQSARTGATSLALELAREATQTDPFSSRTWTWLGAVQRGNGDEFGSESSFATAAGLNGLNPIPWRAWANNRGENESSSTRPTTVELWNRAVANAPRETAIRLDRAQWLLSKNPNDATGLRDLETVVRQRDEPYGRFPAIGDFDNLDFARASLPLAQRALDRGDKKRAQNLAQRALDDIVRARPKVERLRQLAQGSDNEFLQPPQDLDELQTQFETLLSKAKP